MYWPTFIRRVDEWSKASFFRWSDTRTLVTLPRLWMRHITMINSAGWLRTTSTKFNTKKSQMSTRNLEKRPTPKRVQTIRPKSITTVASLWQKDKDASISQSASLNAQSPNVQKKLINVPRWLTHHIWKISKRKIIIKSTYPQIDVFKHCFAVLICCLHFQQLHYRSDCWSLWTHDLIRVTLCSEKKKTQSPNRGLKWEPKTSALNVILFLKLLYLHSVILLIKNERHSTLNFYWLLHWRQSSPPVAWSSLTKTCNNPPKKVLCVSVVEQTQNAWFTNEQTCSATIKFSN